MERIYTITRNATNKTVYATNNYQDYITFLYIIVISVLSRKKIAQKVKKSHFYFT